MSTTEEIDRYILKKYEVHQRLGKGVSPPCNKHRPSLKTRPCYFLQVQVSQQKASSAPETLCAEQSANRHPCITSVVEASDIYVCAQKTIGAKA